MRRRASIAAALVILFSAGCSVEDSGGDSSARGDNKSKHHHKRDGRDGHGPSKHEKETQQQKKRDGRDGRGHPKDDSKHEKKRQPKPTRVTPDRPPARYYAVTEVVDGDTVKVARHGETSIRIIGIDTPETVHPTEPVECGGPRASQLATHLLTGKQVRLVFDPSQGRIDAYGRTLAYLQVRGGPYDFGLAMIQRGRRLSTPMTPPTPARPSTWPMTGVLERLTGACGAPAAVRMWHQPVRLPSTTAGDEAAAAGWQLRSRLQSLPTALSA